MYSIDDLVTSVLSKKVTLLQWNPVTTTTKTTILVLLLLIIKIIIIIVYLTHPRGCFPVQIHYLQLKIKKNALSSISLACLEIMSKAPVLLYYFFHLEYKTSVICHNVNTQKVKIARRDRPHILASNRCETFENLLHIDIAPLRSTLSGILHSKN